MIQSQSRLTGFVIVALLMSGCASIDPQPGFDETRTAVAERIGKDIHWKRGGSEDAAIRAKVRTLLGSPLTIDTAVQVALLNNPGLQAGFSEIGIAQADYVQAGLLHNPMLQATSRSPREGGSANVEFDLSFDFLRLLTMPLRKSMAEQEYARVRADITVRVIDLSGQVRQVFLAAQSDSQLVEMMQQVVTATDASLDTARRLRAAGNINALELDREQALNESARLQLFNAELALIQDRERLNRLLGLWGTATTWRLNPRLPQLPTESIDPSHLESEAIGSSLELAMTRRTLESLGKKAGIENIESFLPTLDVGYSWEREEVTGEIVDGPTIGLQIPIFDMGQARRARVSNQIEQALADYRSTAIRVRSVTRQVWRELQYNREQVEFYERTLLPLRERIVHGEQLQYNAMQIGVFELLVAKQQQIDTGIQYVQKLKDYWQADTRLNLLLAGSISAAEMAPDMSPTPSMMNQNSGIH